MRIRIPIHPAFLKEKENVIEISEEKLKNYMPEVSKKKLEKAVEIIKMISKNPYIFIDEMRAKLYVTDRTVARYISNLKENKIIERVEPDNGGSWKILIIDIMLLLVKKWKACLLSVVTYWLQKLKKHRGNQQFQKN